jgi:hypothetical protein
VVALSVIMNMEIDFSYKSESKAEDVLLTQTKLITAAIKKKAKDYNLDSDKKITFEQLKQIFLEGSSSSIDNKPLLECGFARINMFLRLIKNNSLASEFKNNFSKRVKENFDFSTYISPKDEDFVSASEDVKNFKLDFVIKDINELYFVEAKWVKSFIEFI